LLKGCLTLYCPLQDAAGNTHLHNAVSGPEDVPELVAALLAVGLPANTVNSDGDTALHVAARAGHVEVRRMPDGWLDLYFSQCSS
jgi:ankyrin repeat protein